MKIIYVYKKKSYAAIIAAYVHLKLNTSKQSNNIKHKNNKEGHFLYLGIDQELNEVYLLNSSKPGPILKNLLNGFANLYNEKILVIELENNYNKKDDL